MLTTRERRNVIPAKEWKEIMVRESLSFNFVTNKSLRIILLLMTKMTMVILLQVLLVSGSNLLEVTL